MAAQQGLAAGQPDFLHAMGDEDAGQAGDLLEAQQVLVGQELVVLVEHFLGHAVAAAEVAAVGQTRNKIRLLQNSVGYVTTPSFYKSIALS